MIEEKNWPPFLPILHHSIAKDIPLHTQRIQYFAYGSWLGTKLFILTASCDVIWIVSSDVDSSCSLRDYLEFAVAIFCSIFCKNYL